MIEAISVTLVPLVKRFEGLHKLRNGLVYPYICPAGYPTQGYGLLVESMSVPPITPEEAERRMRLALPSYVNETMKLCPRLWLCRPATIAAMADFTFNLGAPRLRGSTLRRRIAEGDWSGAAVELRKWVHGGGRRLPGLVVRREVEAQLVLKQAEDDASG